jgi:hypothetical protein
MCIGMVGRTATVDDQGETPAQFAVPVVVLVGVDDVVDVVGGGLVELVVVVVGGGGEELPVRAFLIATSYRPLAARTSSGRKPRSYGEQADRKLAMHPRALLHQTTSTGHASAGRGCQA